MYEALLIANNMSDGTLAYPPASEKGVSNLSGMSFEVRYVLFLTSSMSDAFLFIVYIYNLLGTSRSPIQEAKQQHLLLTTFQ
jgi:hypothetical protein